MQAGRPSSYSEETADFICEQLAIGKTLLAICRDNEEMPDRTTVARWMTKMPEFASRIALSRDFGQDFTVDECRDIVDSATPEDFQVARLRVWHRQWEASKRAPKRLGDKLDVNHTTSPIDSFTEDQLRAKLAEMLRESSPTDRSDPNS